MGMLGKLLGGTPASFDAGRFFAAVKKDLFGGKLNQGQVDGMNGILKAMEEVGDKDQDTLAYALATTYHEVGGTMLPVREGFGKTDAESRARVNALALTKIEEALHWLQQRTLDRMRRGVEGKTAA